MGRISIVSKNLASSTYTAPPASPNIASATASVVYNPTITNSNTFGFSGTITYPGTTAYMSTVQVQASPHGTNQWTTIQTVNAPGTTTFSGGNFLMPTSGTASWDLQFVAYNSAGNPTASPVLVTGNPLTVQPAQASSVSAAEVGSRYADANQSVHMTVAITPVFTANVTPLVATVWVNRGDGLGYIWCGWNTFNTVGQAWNFDEYAPLTTTTGTGQASTTWTIAVCAGAIFETSTLPGGAVTHSFSPSLVGTPSSSGATVSVTNVGGSTPTASNIFMGLNGAGNPWWAVDITLNTPGTSDINTQYYAVWCEWVNNVGTPISPGGVSNVPGWVINNELENNGQSYTWQLSGNYPAPGVDAYMQVSVWAISRAAYAPGSTLSQVAPYTSNSFAVLQTTTTNTKFEVGPPPTTTSANALVNPNFAQGLIGWTPTGTITQISTGLPPITYAQVVVATGGGAGTLTQKFTARPGDSYTFEAWAQLTTGTISSASVNVLYYNSTGGQLANNFTSFSPTSTLTAYAISGTAPANTVSMVVEVTFIGNGTVLITNCWLGPGAGAGLGRSGNQPFVSLATNSGLSTSGGLGVTTGNGLTVSSGQVAVNLDPSASFSFVSGKLSQNLSTDFVVSGGVLNQNAVNLAKSYGFNTTNFTTSGGTSLAVNSIAVSTLISGNTFNLGTSVFGSSTSSSSTTQAYLAMSSSGLVAGDNYNSPVNTAVFSSGGITLTNATSGAQAIFNSGGIKLWNGSGTAQVTISSGSGILIQNGAGTNYVQINSSQVNIVNSYNGITTSLNNNTRFGYPIGMCVDDGTNTTAVGSSFFGIYHDSGSFNYANLELVGTQGSLLLADSSTGNQISFTPTTQTFAPAGGSLAIPNARYFVRVIATIGGSTFNAYIPLL